MMINSGDVQETLGLFRWLANLPRRLRIGKNSKVWPCAEADVYDWAVVAADAASPDADSFQVRGTLAYTLNMERHYGLLFSTFMTRRQAEDFIASGQKIKRITVRYDPNDPDEMLAEDQARELPFKLRIG